MNCDIYIERIAGCRSQTRTEEGRWTQTVFYSRYERRVSDIKYLRCDPSGGKSTNDSELFWLSRGNFCYRSVISRLFVTINGSIPTPVEFLMSFKYIRRFNACHTSRSRMAIVDSLPKCPHVLSTVPCNSHGCTHPCKEYGGSTRKSVGTTGILSKHEPLTMSASQNHIQNNLLVKCA